MAERGQPALPALVAGMLRARAAERDAALAALRARGIDPVARRAKGELRCDYWFAEGMVKALEDLAEELCDEEETA